MSSTLWIGTTGLAASEKQMDVIGNNLANANTVGFKAADTYFASMLSQSLSGGGGSQEVGQGVSVAAVSTVFAQGSFESTGNATDLAIDGTGFFVLKDQEGNSLYTRAGAFHVNKDGLLADTNNYLVQGHMFDSDGIVESEAQTELDLRSAQSEPRPTTTFGVGVTLDSQTITGGTFNTSQVVYDSRGAKHDLNNVFTKMEDPKFWAVQTSLSDNNTTINAVSQTYSGLKFNALGVIDKVYTGDIGTPTETSAAGTMTSAINSVGSLYKSTTAPIVLTRGANADTWTMTGNGGYANMSLALGTTGTDDKLQVDLDGTGGADITFTLAGAWANADTISFSITHTEATPADITARYYAVGAALSDGATIGDDAVSDGDVVWNLVGEDAPMIRSYATTSRISSLVNDGYAPGILSSLAIDKDGIVEGKFSNGQQQKLARLLLADFPSIQGLNKVGSYFTETANSGASVKNKPGSGGLGELQSNSLEVSNTDVAKEFIKMISAQRAYQSSAKIITTADQMLQQLMNIKQ